MATYPQINGLINVVLNTRENQALLNALPASYSTYRLMAQVPTIALTLGLMAAPIMAGNYSIETDDGVDDKVADYAQALDNDIHNLFVERSIFSGTKYGWAGFEWQGIIKNGQVFAHLIHLLPDLNYILITPEGDFAGYRQTAYGSITVPSVGSDIPAYNCIHVPMRVEGQDWRGQSLLENLRLTYIDYLVVAAAATKYDLKMAGSMPKIGYPTGKTEVNGTITNNAEVAQAMNDGLTSGKGVIYPTTQQIIDGLAGGPQEWEIGVFEDSSPRQASFVERLNYFCVQFVRGLIMPERAVVEGTYGTKAESTQHTNNALQYSEYQARLICDGANILLDRLVELNFGPDMVGKVRYKPAPLVDDKREYIASIFKDVVKDPSIITKLDLDSIMDQLGVAKSEETVAPAVAPVAPNTQETVNG